MLRFELARPGPTRIDVFDIRGRLLRALVADDRNAGSYAVVWDGRDDAGVEVASGTYLARLRSGAFSESRKLQLLR